MEQSASIYSILLVNLLFSLAACNAVDPDAKKILFVGNSYTYGNSLPKMFEEMAESGGHAVHAGMSAPAGWRLSQHAESKNLRDTLASAKWDVVVLQEQSVLPSISSCSEEMYPAARKLHRQIAGSGAETMFFMTWGRQDGRAVQQVGFTTFADMQIQLNIGYRQIANELGVPLAPVGIAWLMAYTKRPELPLWREDGSHPTEHGSYLAAAVFYATIFQESPEGLSYTAGLPKEDAHFLQHIVAITVLSDLNRWNVGR
jgi:hypothetical protein